jgi:protein-L-isoaspartate O-methyltransferase
MNDSENSQCDGAAPAAPIAMPKDSEQRAAYTNIRGDVAQLVPVAAKRILDVGCSNGALGGLLRSLVPQRVITGIEIDQDFARSAEKVLDHVIQASIEENGVKERLAAHAPFDCIICADVLEHLREPWTQLATLASLLDKNGTMVISFPNIRHHSALASIFIRGHFPRRPRGLFDATHLRWFTFSDGINLLGSVGLEPDASCHAVRMGDRGGGMLNRIAGKLLDPIAGFWPIREFLVYQFVIRAHRTTHP